MVVDVELAAMPRRTRGAAANVTVTAVAHVLGKVSTLAWIIVAARTLSQDDFGTFNLALAIALLVSAAVEWGFDAVLVQQASRDPERLSVYHSRAVAWEMLVGAPVFTAAGIVVWLTSDSSARTALLLVLVAVFIELWTDTSRASSAAARNQAGTATALVVQRFATACLAIPALLLGFGLVGLAVAFLVSYVIGWGASLVAVRRIDVRFRMSLVDRRGMRDFVSRTWAIGASALVLMALFRIDTILLAAFTDDAAVATYSAAYRLLETALFLAFSITGALVPLMAAADAGPRRVREVMESGLTVMGAAYLPFAAVCLVDAAGVLDLLYGGNYGEESAGALRWLSLAPLAFGIAYLSNGGLTAVCRSGGLLVGSVVATAVNVGLNLIIIPRYAGTGAAFVTTLSYFVQAAIVLAFLGRASERIRLAPALVDSAVASVIYALVLLALPLPALVEIVLGGLVYAGVWVALLHRRDPDRLASVRALVPGRRAGG